MTELKKKKKSPLATVFTVVLSLLMLAGTGYFLWQISREVETTFTLLTDINDAKKELADLNRSLRKGMMYMRIPDLSKAEFRSYTPLVKMASMFQNIEVPYTWETYQKHI